MISKHQAHPFGEECVVCHPRWQDIPNGWYVNANQLPTWLVVTADVVFLLFAFGLIWLFIVALSA